MYVSWTMSAKIKLIPVYSPFYRQVPVSNESKKLLKLQLEAKNERTRQGVQFRKTVSPVVSGRDRQAPSVP